METHTYTCCAGANLKLVSLYNEVCKVSPLLDPYKRVKEIPVARVSALWMDPTTSREYLIVGDQFLWFRTMTNNYLINPNQVRVFNIPVQDNPFDATVFGIEVEKPLSPQLPRG